MVNHHSTTILGEDFSASKSRKWENIHPNALKIKWFSVDVCCERHLSRSYPPEVWHSPWKVTFPIGKYASNHHFSGAMLNFGDVVLIEVCVFVLCRSVLPLPGILEVVLSKWTVSIDSSFVQAKKWWLLMVECNIRILLSWPRRFIRRGLKLHWVGGCHFHVFVWWKKIGLSPFPVIVANEGIGSNPVLKVLQSWWWLLGTGTTQNTMIMVKSCILRIFPRPRSCSPICFFKHYTRSPCYSQVNLVFLVLGLPL